MHASALSFAASFLAAAVATGDTTAVLGGRVFDGTGFVPRDLFIRDGVFVDRLDAPPDLSIDAEGTWIVPPYAECHTHTFLTGPISVGNSEEFLRSGVFYAASMNNSAGMAEAYQAALPDGPRVDLIWAHGGITRTECHPVPLYRTIHVRWQGGDPDTFMSGALGNVFHIADTTEQLEAIWPYVRRGRPDIIKTFLLYSESFDRGADAEHKGMDPVVLRRLVELAHEEGKRVALHIETGRDFENGLECGVDVFAHLPYDFARTPEADWGSMRISPNAAARAAERGVPVMATLSLVTASKDPTSPPDEPAPGFAVAADNLRVLKEAGVTILVGSDAASPVAEMNALRETGVFSNLELLRMWSIDSPKFIFPERDIGSLEPGAEASLLVLEADPLAEFEAAGQIRAAMKQGEWIELQAATD